MKPAVGKQKRKEYERPEVYHPHPGRNPGKRLTTRQHAQPGIRRRQQRCDGVLGGEEAHGPEKTYCTEQPADGVAGRQAGAMIAPTGEKLTAITVFSSQ